MRRKANGRLCYKSPQDLLKRLLPNEVVSLILEYRQLIHAVKRIETIQRSAEAPRMEPLCSFMYRDQWGPSELQVVNPAPSAQAILFRSHAFGQTLYRLARQRGDWQLLQEIGSKANSFDS